MTKKEYVRGWIHVSLDKEFRKVQQAFKNLYGITITKKKASKIYPQIKIKSVKININKEIKKFLEK
jgi:hypothetical protein